MDSCIRGKTRVALLLGKYKGKVVSHSELVLRLDENRFDIIFIHFGTYDVERNLTQQIRRRVFCLFNRNPARTFNLSILCKLVRILKEQKVDIIHCHSHECTVHGTLAAMIARTPVVLSHIHGLGRSRRLRRKLINLLLFRRINRVIGCARSVRDDVLKNNPFVCPEKVIALENSIDFDFFANVSITKVEAKSKLIGVPTDAFVYGTVARFGPYKGHSFLIKAFERVRKKVPSAHLILAGDGLLKEEIQKQAAKASLDDSVHFLGRRDDIPKLLRAMDAFVLPSIGSEGMPKAILEAMAAGVPCIASSLSGIPEVINNSDVGLLVPPKDVNALAEAMIELVKMPEKKRQKLVDNARQKVYSCHSHRVVMRKLENIYETELAYYYESNRRQKSNV